MTTQAVPSKMGRSKAQMLVATAGRMAGGLATFIILARYLGPEQFGVIAAAIAYSTLAGIASDYGLVAYSTRSGGASPQNAAQIVTYALRAKFVLVGGLLCLGGILLLVTQPLYRFPIYSLVFLGTLAASFADLALVVVRVAGRFDVEAKLVTVASIGWLLIVGIAAAITHDALWSAVAYCVSRSLYLLGCLFALHPWLSLKLEKFSIAEIGATLRSASTYAVDSMLTTFSSQIDVFLFGALMSARAFGIYQAGGRLVQVVLPFAVVLSTVYLPRLSSASAQKNDREFAILSRSVTIEFTTLAILAAAGFAIVGPILTRLLYGDPYAQLVPLWYGFAVFAMLRLVAAGLGIQLVAIGEIRTRIGNQVISIVVFVAATWICLPIWGLEGSSWILAASAIPSFTLMAWGVATHVRDIRLIAAVSAIVILCGGSVVAAAMFL
ncbi:lipopolysaccharide biosynthesis protein [Sphingobium sp. H39-3-25]|uniref:lipopolysaccharide biosynthesis protein n=1 Tax=Sphingobium arseniciresistens TaxID=3030834 RepID=UPI0023B946C6|nr:lipopolysaccharide biosynthesis protein [Sphingobium arseniciresistens]